MKSIFVLTCFLLLLTQSKLGIGQSFVWADQFGGIDRDEGLCVEVDDLGNVYVAGTFEETFGINPNVIAPILVSNGAKDIFIAKVNSVGELMWIQHFGGEGADIVSSIAISTDGEVYLAGWFQETVDFQTQVFSSVGETDGILLRLDANGGVDWAIQYGSEGFDYVREIALDEFGFMYIGGRFMESLDFDPGPDQWILDTGPHFDNAFISKLSTNGNLVWVQSFGGLGSTHIHDLHLTYDSSLLVTGMFYGPEVDFNSGPGDSILQGIGTADAYLLKLDTSGDFQYVKMIPGLADHHSSRGWEVLQDQEENIFIGGVFGWGADFDPGPNEAIVYANPAIQGNFDAFLLKLDSQANFVWVKHWGNENYDLVEDMVLDSYGDIVLTTWFEGTVDFDFGQGPLYLTSENQDLGLLKFSNDGDLIWALKSEGDCHEWAKSLAIDASDQLYLTGGFNCTTNFNFGWEQDFLTSYDLVDAFLLKLGSTPVSLNTAIGQQALRIFPSVSEVGFSVVNETGSLELDIEIFDLKGRCLLRQSGLEPSHQFVYVDWSPGMYIVRLRTGKELSSFRFIKQ